MQIVEAATIELLQKYKGGKIVAGPTYPGSDYVIYGEVTGIHLDGGYASVRIMQKGMARDSVKHPDSVTNKTDFPRDSISSMRFVPNVTIDRTDGSLKFIADGNGYSAVIARP